ncbi:hypothetical protein BaRGS_00006959, partial [Batillaria attramentaria]
AMQMNQLNIMQGRNPSANPNNSGGLLSPSASSQLVSHVSAAQAAQFAAAAAGNNGNLAAVSMAMPVNNNGAKVTNNGNKANVFSQAGNVAPTFVTQSKGQSLTMPIQAQPQLINSQAPIRLSQPQLVTNTGQIISSPTMLTNPAILQAMANLQQQVWGVTSTGQIVPQAMLENPTALQGNANPQGVPLATPQQIMGGQGQSQAFMAGQSLFIRTAGPLQQQIPGMMAPNMQGFPALKGGKVQIEPNIQGPTLGKTILPSTSRTAVTAKIQPNVANTLPNQAPRLNIPVVPKQKSRPRATPKTATVTATAMTTTLTTAVPITVSTVAPLMTTASPLIPVQAHIATLSAASSPSKPSTPITPTPSTPTPAPVATTKSQSDSEVETGKKHTPTDPVIPTTTAATPTKDSTTVTPTTPQTAPASDTPAKSRSPESATELKEEKDEEEDMEIEKPVASVEGVTSSAMPPAPPVAVPSLPLAPVASLGLSLPSAVEKQRAIVKPHILTHVIDGFIIQEGPEPFPVQRSSLLTEFVPPKPMQPVEKESEDDNTEYDDQPPPLLNQSEAHFSGTGEADIRKCEYCGKTRLANKFRKSGRFCSMACAKRYNVACSRRVGKFHKGSPAGKYVPKKKHGLGVKKGWRTGRGGRLAYNINMRPAPNEMSSSNSGQETSSSAASPPPQQDFDVEMEVPKTDPAKWSVIEVYEFVKSLPGCQEYADEFRQQEIDGQALLLLKEDHLMTAMSIKLGPALKICARINTLREEALNSAGAVTAV